jgi:hypothetical protein
VSKDAEAAVASAAVGRPAAAALDSISSWAVKSECQLVRGAAEGCGSA